MSVAHRHYVARVQRRIYFRTRGFMRLFQRSMPPT
jgi:hypothetical protein